MSKEFNENGLPSKIELALHKEISAILEGQSILTCINVLMQSLLNVTSQGDTDLQEIVIRALARLTEIMADDLAEEHKLMSNSH